MRPEEEEEEEGRREGIGREDEEEGGGQWRDILAIREIGEIDSTGTRKSCFTGSSPLMKGRGRIGVASSIPTVNETCVAFCSFVRVSMAA